MKNLKQILAALVAFAAFTLTSNAAVVYSDSGQAGPGYAYLTDAWGSFGVSYDSADWYAEYDDEGTAQYGYVLYTADGVHYVDATFGDFSPDWSFISLTTDSLEFLAPSFLSDFWAAFP